MTDLVPLGASKGIGHKGFMPYGLAFWVSKPEAINMGLGNIAESEKFIRPYLNGRDLNQQSRNRYVLDFHEQSETFVREKFPKAYQHLLDNSKKIRAEDKMKYRRNYRWRFGQPSTEMRAALEGMPFFIGTTETAAHRIFSSLDGSAAPDQKIRVVACSDWAIFAVLCSRVHVEFSFRTGGWQGKGNDPVYQHTNTFTPFPFPDFEKIDPSVLKQLRSLGEKLDKFRKSQISANPKQTLTNMYNCLEAVRLAEHVADYEMSDWDKATYAECSIAILKQYHDEIDTMVLAAYGWSDMARVLVGRQGATKPHQPKAQEQIEAEQTLMFRLVALNKERAEEEARGHIRWLRPAYQNPTGVQAATGKTTDMDLGVVAKIEKAPWPKTLPAQIAAVREALNEAGEATPDQIARRFVRARAGTVEPLLDSLAALGQADKGEDGRYAA